MIRVMSVIVTILNMGIAPVAAQSPTLAAFVGKDLRKVSADELAPLYKVLEKKKENEFPFGLAPWYVWKTNQSMPQRFIVFEGRRILIIPGASSATIHLFDQNGKKIKDWSFFVGWRIDLTGASFQYSHELAAPIITVNTARVVGGDPIQKQYYAFSGDRLRLMRIEDEKRRVFPNVYVYPNHTLGPHVDTISLKQWMSFLESPNKVDILSALTFVGGVHMNLSRPEPGAEAKDIKRAKMAEKLRGGRRVRELVRRYRKSKNRWVKEAAQLAAHQMAID